MMVRCIRTTGWLGAAPVTYVRQRMCLSKYAFATATARNESTFFHPADETPFPMRQLFLPKPSRRPVFFFFVFRSQRSGGERRTAIAVLKNDD